MNEAPLPSADPVGFDLARSAAIDDSPTQEEIDGVAAVFDQVAADPIAAGSAYIMAKKLRRVFRGSDAAARLAEGPALKAMLDALIEAEAEISARIRAHLACRQELPNFVSEKTEHALAAQEALRDRIKRAIALGIKAAS